MLELVHDHNCKMLNATCEKLQTWRRHCKTAWLRPTLDIVSVRYWKLCTQMGHEIVQLLNYGSSRLPYALNDLNESRCRKFFRALPLYLCLCNEQTGLVHFFVMKPTRCTNFTNLFCHETLHVSDSSSVHHQESSSRARMELCSILVLLESCLQTCMTYTIAECTANKLLMMDRRTVRNM